jgi:tagaturonate reductase
MKYKAPRPVTVLQYGEGNFLRGFVDYMIDAANEKHIFNGNVQIVKAIPQGSLEALKAQDCVYTVLLRGKRDHEIYVEKRVITSVAGAVCAYEEYKEYAAFAASPHLQFIVSNTTEAGIVYDDTDAFDLNPPKSFPGKLTKFLYERYVFFKGAEDRGLIILPVELIENNGGQLLECCLRLADLWGLSQEFVNWLTNCNYFCNTLVDRIITGYPADEALAINEETGFDDKLIVAGEPFALWVIESKRLSKVARKFALDKAWLPVLFTKDLSPYRERKVRVLNGTHTSSVLAAYLSGLDTVGDMMKDELLRGFVEAVMYDELSPMVPLPQDEVKSFADSVIDRFENPFIRHNLLTIALNSFSKFKVRVLPTILETYEKTGALPKRLCFSLAAFIQFYRVGERNGIPYQIMDDSFIKDFFAANKDLPPCEFVPLFLKDTQLWGQDLSAIPNFVETVANNLTKINELGMRGAIEWIR